MGHEGIVGGCELALVHVAGEYGCATYDARWQALGRHRCRHLLTIGMGCRSCVCEGVSVAMRDKRKEEAADLGNAFKGLW